jgi:hypothetical protein
MFVTAEAHAHVRFKRVIERRALWMAEDTARELPNLPLEDALQLVSLYAEREPPKYEKAALRWLERYLAEGSPRLQHFAEIAAGLAKRKLGWAAPMKPQLRTGYSECSHHLRLAAPRCSRSSGNGCYEIRNDPEMVAGPHPVDRVSGPSEPLGDVPRRFRISVRLGGRG